MLNRRYVYYNSVILYMPELDEEIEFNGRSMSESLIYIVLFGLCVKYFYIKIDGYLL